MNPFEKDWRKAKVYEGTASPLAKAVIGPIVDQAIKEGVLPEPASGYRINDVEAEVSAYLKVKREAEDVVIDAALKCGVKDDPLTSRRLRAYAISCRYVWDIINGDFRVQETGIPVGSRVLAVFNDQISDCFIFKVWHPSFEEVPWGGEMERCYLNLLGEAKKPYVYKVQSGDNRIRIEFATHGELMAYIQNQT